MSKMNKAELYALAKQQKEELMTASLFNNSLEEENEKLKKQVSTLVSRQLELIEELHAHSSIIKKYASKRNEKNIHYKKLEEENEYFKSLKEDPNWECGFK